MESFGRGRQQNIMYAHSNSYEPPSRCSGKIVIPLPNWSQKRKQEFWLRIREETERGNLGLSAEAMCDDKRHDLISKDENSIEIDTHHFFDVNDLARIIHHLFEMGCIPIKVHGMNMCDGNLNFIVTRNEKRGSFNEFLRQFRKKYGDYFNKGK